MKGKPPVGSGGRESDLTGGGKETVMLDPEKNKFTVINNEGKEVVCDILFTFDSADTGKSYIVYTDNSRDEVEGYIRVFAAVLCEIDDDRQMLLPVKTDKEWDMLEAVLDEVQTSVREHNGAEAQ